MSISIRRMTSSDIPEAEAIEAEAFPLEPTRTPFQRELDNRLSGLLVACDRAGSVLAFSSLWFIVDEAHLLTIAVAAANRRLGFGWQLMVASLEAAIDRETTMMTLEVRASNTAAQQLYRKLGFRKVGIRKGYYTDNHEDALIMTVDRIDTTAYRSVLESFKTTVRHAE